MKHRIAVLAAALAALAAPAAASAATLTVDPAKRCYGAGERVSLLGSGFTANQMSGVTVTRDDETLGTLSTDARGMFHGTLTLGQRTGQRTSTYTATDTANPMTTASAQLVVNELAVRIKPRKRIVGHRVTIGAEGFTTGRTLWAHRIKGRTVRHIRIGRLKHPCRKLQAKRRLLPRRPAPGVYRIQFDTFRRYAPTRRVRFVRTVRLRLRTD